MFGLAKQSLVICFDMNNKMKKTYLNRQGANKGLFQMFDLGDELNGPIKSHVWVGETRFTNGAYVSH
jgi:hypothetical protein